MSMMMMTAAKKSPKAKMVKKDRRQTWPFGLKKYCLDMVILCSRVMTHMRRMMRPRRHWTRSVKPWTIQMCPAISSAKKGGNHCNKVKANTAFSKVAATKYKMWMVHNVESR